MAMIRCQKGHYYEPSRYSSCPYCGVNINIDSGATKAISYADKPEQPADNTVPGTSRGMDRCPKGHFYDASKNSKCPFCNIQPGIGETVAFKGKDHAPKAGSHPDEGSTVGIVRKKIGIDPVAGWLVCTGGVNKGRDYRIKSEKNFIGRSESNDICISGDESISRINHACISYNPKKNSFRLYFGEGRGIVYLNGQEVDMPMELHAYDIIELGRTRLMFIPLCNDKFQWESGKEE